MTRDARLLSDAAWERAMSGLRLTAWGRAGVAVISAERQARIKREAALVAMLREAEDALADVSIVFSELDIKVAGERIERWRACRSRLRAMLAEYDQPQPGGT